MNNSILKIYILIVLVIPFVRNSNLQRFNAHLNKKPANLKQKKVIDNLKKTKNYTEYSDEIEFKTKNKRFKTGINDLYHAGSSDLKPKELKLNSKNDIISFNEEDEEISSNEIQQKLDFNKKDKNLKDEPELYYLKVMVKYFKSKVDITANVSDKKHDFTNKISKIYISILNNLKEKIKETEKSKNDDVNTEIESINYIRTDYAELENCFLNKHKILIIPNLIKDYFMKNLKLLNKVEEKNCLELEKNSKIAKKI